MMERIGHIGRDLLERAYRNAERAAKGELVGASLAGGVPVEEPSPVGLPPKVPARYAVAVDELEHTAAVRAARGWVSSGGQGLLLVGAPGRGKSAIAGALAMEAWPRALFWPVGALLRAVKEEFGRPDQGTIVRRATETDLLVLDDVGVEQPSDWSRALLSQLIDDRYASAAGRLIVVTNLAPDDPALAGHVGERAVSRLAEMCTVVPVVGPDRRRQ